MAGANASNFSELIRGHQSTHPVRQGYAYYVSNVGGVPQAQLWLRDELICSGSTMELFVYSMHEHFGGAVVMVNELRAGAEYVWSDSRNVSLPDLLVEFREARRLSPGLNRLTKLAQFDTIDQDHVCLKFCDADFLSSDEIKIVHPGSGPLGGTHLLFEQPVKLIDPLIKWSGRAYDTFISGKYDDGIAKCDAVISDVATGDANGLSAGTTLRFASAPTVFLKLDLQDSDGPNGRPVRKPRPHNSEIIWEVDPDGPTWEQQKPALMELVIEANRNRMEEFLRLRGCVRVKPPGAAPRRINFIKRRKYACPVPAVSKMSHSINARPRLAATSIKRSRAFKELCENTTEDDYHAWCAQPRSWCKLARSFLRPGSASRLDCGFGTCLFALRSVLLSANLHGWKVTRNGIGWLIWPPDRPLPTGN